MPPGDGGSPSDTGPGPVPDRRIGPMTLVRAGFVVAAVGLGVYAVARDLDGFRTAVATIGPARSALAIGLVLLGLVVSAEVWRTSVVPVTGDLDRPAAGAVFFVSQLGKYIPGGVWTIAAQVDLARRYGLRRTSMGVGALLYLGFHVASGIVVAAVLLPIGTPGLLSEHPWVLAATAVTIVGLLPPVLNTGIAVGLRLLRQPRLAQPLTTSQLARPLGWLLMVWALFGLATFVVAAPLAASGDRPTLFVLSVGGFALAWVVGVLVIPAPAGVGAREVALVLAFAPVLSVTQATSVAVILRVAHTTSDLALAALSRAAGRRRPGTAG